MECCAGGLSSPEASHPNDHNCNECIIRWVSIVRLRHTKLGFLRPSGAELGGAFVEFSLNRVGSGVTNRAGSKTHQAVFNGGCATTDGLQLIEGEFGGHWLRSGGGLFPPMNTPSPESPIHLATCLTISCDVAHVT